jgi:hypothetical protein
MRNLNLPIYFSLLLLAAVITLSCGTSSSSTRSIQSVSISPATATAQPGEQVQFTATGIFDAPPSPVTPVTATWGSCYQNAPTTAVTVSSNGIAQCASGASGTYTVWADVVQQGQRACPAYATACGGAGCVVTGTAQLTCP